MIGDAARSGLLAVIVVLASWGYVGAVVVATGASASDEWTVPAQLPPRTGIWPVNITLYGDAVLGWGLSDTTISDPGPSLTVSRGDVVNLTLISNDLLDHTWFIDYDNDTQPDGNEPSSPTFNDAATPPWDFVADRPGLWTYRCEFHPGTMTGSIRILAEPRPVNLTMYGHTTGGWGFSNTTITAPGPPIVVVWGTNVTLTLRATDGVPHDWFIDYNNDTDQNAGEPKSEVFNIVAAPVVTWSFIADRTGNWTYRCGFHPFTMTGLIQIVGGPPPPEAGVMVPLITTLMLGALGFVFVFAVVYHVRAVRASKRRR